MTYTATLSRLLRVLVWALMLGGMAGGVHAQGTTGGQTSAASSLDKRLFDRIYQIQAPAFRRGMRAANATAYPVFVGGVAAAWLGVWALRGGDDWSDAYRLTVSEIAALGTTVGVKYLVRRPRPYVRFSDVEARTHVSRWDPYSFPSGHAAIAFALATSWTLSHPKWYVAVPGYVWATSVAVSRVWLGVHYPSDVLFGALLGGVVAWGIHTLGTSITPAFLQRDDAPPTMPVLHLRVPLP